MLHTVDAEIKILENGGKHSILDHLLDDISIPKHSSLY